MFPDDDGDVCGPSRPTARQTLPHSGLVDGLLQKHPSGRILSIDLCSKSNAQCRQILEFPPGNPLYQCYSCVYTPMHTNDIVNSEIHNLCLNIRLTERGSAFFGEKGITNFVKKNRSLVGLYLTLYVVSTDHESSVLQASHAAYLEDVAQFARTVGASNVRGLRLGFPNAVGARAFLDNLPPSHIHSLTLAIVGRRRFDREEGAAFVDSLARFLADPVRSRSVKCIYSDPMSNEASFLLQHIILGSRATVNAGSPEILFAQKPNLSVLSVNGRTWNAPSNNLISFPAWMQHSRYSLENGPPRQAFRNIELCRRTQQEAHDLLRIARIVGCRAQFLGHAPGVIPFFKIPGELRIRVLSMLAPHLDRNQIINVLSWACCAETIGHCCQRRVDTRPPMEPTLDVPPWDWDKCSVNGSHGTLTYPEINSYVWPGSVQRQKHVIPFVESTGTNVPSLSGWYDSIVHDMQ